MSRKLKGYSRVDSDDAHGWLVRIKRGDVRKSRFISDSTNGGKRKSEKVAKDVYDAWVKELPPPETSRDKLGKRNTTGIVGVHHSWDQDSRFPNCKYESYVASWVDDDGKRRNIRFSINKYGKKVAFELACLCRAQRIRDRAAVEEMAGQSGKKGASTKSAKKAANAKKATGKKASSKKPAAKKVTKKKKRK
ncbi:MAG: hypothetical protein KDB22_24305 [Planctomycetales bacterium]|nr:hypothetical protein [Planctomycetales bacterium]